MTTEIKDQINVHRQKQEWEEVVPLAEQVMEQDPADISILRKLVEAYENLEDQEKVIETWRLLVDRHHEVSPFARKLGLALKEAGDPESRGYLEQALLVAIDRKATSEVEEIWIELVEMGATRATAFQDFAQRLCGRKEKVLAGELLLILVETGNLDTGDQLACLKNVMEYLPERHGEFRQSLIDSFKDHYGDRPDIDKLVDLSAIATSEDLVEAMTNLDRYLKFGEGQFFYHQSWGAGQVKSIEPSHQRVQIDFAKKKNHTLTLEMADKSLIPIPQDDLRARWLVDKDGVHDLMESDPVALIKSALVALNGKAGGKDLKIALLSSPIPEDRWQKWWTSVNKKLPNDPFVEVTGTSLKTYTLRDEPESPDEQFSRHFRKERTLRGKLDLFAQYLTQQGPKASNEILERVASDLISIASASKSEREIVETAFHVSDLGDKISPDAGYFEKLIDPLKSDLNRAVKALGGIKNSTHQTRWFELISESLGEEITDAYETLMHNGPDSVRDLIAQQLADRDQNDVLMQLFRKTRMDYRDQPGLFIWFAKQFLIDPEKASEAGLARPGLVEHLVTLHEVLDYRAQTSQKDDSSGLRAHMTNIRQLLKQGNFKLLRAILTETEPTMARTLWKAADSAAALEDRIRKEITAYISAQFEGIATEPQQEAESAMELAAPLPSHLLCLMESLESKRAQIKQIKEVDLPHNTEEIETARQQGDLRENAEYHAAKEKQGVLLNLAATLEEEINRAVVVPEQDYTGDIVRFGSRTVFRINDEEKTVTLLGPWESDPDHDILSYESPLGQLLWSRHVGDQMDFDQGGRVAKVEILSIESILAPV